MQHHAMIKKIMQCERTLGDYNYGGGWCKSNVMRSFTGAPAQDHLNLKSLRAITTPSRAFDVR